MSAVQAIFGAGSYPLQSSWLDVSVLWDGCQGRSLPARAVLILLPSKPSVQAIVGYGFGKMLVHLYKGDVLLWQLSPHCAYELLPESPVFIAP